MKVKELLDVYSGGVGNIVAVMYNGECIYQDWADNHKANSCNCMARDVKSFWFNGKRLNISIW